MLLSMFISFLLRRRFSSKVWFGLIAVLIVLVSLFSLAPLPLSFPFHVSYLSMLDPFGSIFHTPINLVQGFVTFRLHFLTLEINAVTESNFYGGAFFLYYSFFLLVNIVGAIVGYWINRSTLVKRMLKKKVS